jgi:heterotetrameric sarcosine oxidase delta subunit
MLLIPCPHCGERDESEFNYGGRVADFPELQADMSTWYRAIHLPDVNDPIVNEVWFHASGCECWIQVKRDIRTHEFQPIDKLDQDHS